MMTLPSTPRRGLNRGGLVCLLLTLSAAGRLTAAESSKSAFETDPTGWVDMMPPADLKSWSRVPVPPGTPLGKPQWRVEESGKVLVCGGDSGHLCSR